MDSTTLVCYCPMLVNIPYGNKPPIVRFSDFSWSTFVSVYGFMGIQKNNFPAKYVKKVLSKLKIRDWFRRVTEMPVIFLNQM